MGIKIRKIKEMAFLLSYCKISPGTSIARQKGVMCPTLLQELEKPKSLKPLFLKEAFIFMEETTWDV